MIKTGLLVATSQYRDWFDNTLPNEVDFGNVKMQFVDSVDEATMILEKVQTIDIVFVGGAEPFHLEIVQHLWAASPTASIHIKGKDMDPYLFIGGILEALSAAENRS